MSTAEGIARLKKDVLFRSGIWKPRTRPGTFEGVGEKGLEWMRSVRETFGFKITTEVANAQHVEACLKAEVDVLWIGARTTVNPFSVQEIADSLKGVDVPVFVKNPIHPDLSLWIGAIERVATAGTNKIGAIHRGFSYHDNYPYRNLPNWELAIELRRRCPEMPMICDVSHIAGDPKLIPQVAQRAMDLNMSGLLVETHIDPPSALSDAKQQLTPDQLEQLLLGLHIRESSIEDADSKSELRKMRDRIDTIDESLLRILAERMHVVQQIALHKKERGITPFQLERWQEIYSQYESWGEAMGLEKELIIKLGRLIHEFSIDLQDKMMNSQKSK